VLQTKLATHPIDEDSPSRKAAREVRVARDLIAAGQVEQAFQLLSREDDTQATPTTSPIITERLTTKIEALILLHRPDDALELLNKLDTGDDVSPRLQTLRAKALIAKDNWDDAKALLVSSLAIDPTDADAHQQLGRVYEHEADWEKAAIEYRLAGALTHSPATQP
jgi:tetratricopeptide (TPR) repeat protein